MPFVLAPREQQASQPKKKKGPWIHFAANGYTKERVDEKYATSSYKPSELWAAVRPLYLGETVTDSEDEDYEDYDTEEEEEADPDERPMTMAEIQALNMMSEWAL